MKDALNLPNAISMLRFPLAAAFILVDGVAARVAIVALAAASDWIDGRLARATGSVTPAGELLDPIADKTFMLAALVALAAYGLLPAWTLPLFLVRDIGVALGAVIHMRRGMRMRMPARRAGKVVTWLQFTGIGTILLWPQTAPWIAPLVAVTGAVALYDYALNAESRAPPSDARDPFRH